MKRFLAYLLSFVSAVSLFAFVGCNRNSVRNDPATLVVWVQSVNQPEFFAWAKKEFEASHPGKTIRVDVKLEGALGDTLDVTLGSKDAPDMTATYGGLTVSKLVKGGKVLNVNDIVTETVGDQMNEAAAYNTLDGNGEYYSIPLSGFISPVIYYNKTYFTQNNLQVPSTYDEFVSLSASIRAKGKQPLVAGFSTWHLPHFMQAVHARTMSPENFDKLIGTDKEENPYLLPGYKEGWNLFGAMQTDGIFCDNITGYDTNTANTEFINGKALMYTAPSLDLYTLLDATTFDIGTFLLPPAPQRFLPEGLTEDDMKDATLASGVYTDVMVIDAKSTKIELAEEFAKFLLSQEAQAKLLEFDMLPVRKDISLDGANEVLKPVIEQMNKGVSGFYQSFSATGIDLKLLEAGQKMITSKLDAASAAKIISDYYQAEVMDK